MYSSFKVVDELFQKDKDQCKPWDATGIANECSLINTIFCEPDDDRTGPKHVA